MTIAQLILKVRAALADETATYRWSDAIMLAYAGRALREIVKWHPWSRLNTSGNLVSVTTPDETTDIFPLGEEYHDAAQDYMCFLALSEDNADSVNTGMAGMFKARFEEDMGIRGL